MENERKYFININGNNVGPLKFGEVTERIINGLLSPDDYIFIVGDTQWKFIKDVEEFKAQVAAVKKPVSSKIWFIRKEKHNLGPLSTEEVAKMLRSGEIDVNDYAWKKGLQNWITLKESGEFKIRLDDKKEQAVKTTATIDTEVKAKSEPEQSKKPSLEMVKPPAAEEYVKPKRKRLLPELMLGFILFFIGMLEVKTNQLIGGLIAGSGVAVIFIFLRIHKK